LDGVVVGICEFVGTFEGSHVGSSLGEREMVGTVVLGNEVVGVFDGVGVGCGELDG